MGERFQKMNRNNFAAMIEVIKGEQQAAVVSYIIKEINLSDNTLNQTQRQIAKACKVSTKTVNEAIKALCEKGVLKKKYGRSGIYMLSPDVFYRGYEYRKFQLDYDFRNFDKEPDERTLTKS